MKPYYQDSEVEIYLGDSREVLPHLGRFDLLLTDPAYGLGHDAAAHRNMQRGCEGWKSYGDTNWDAERTPADLLRLVLDSADEAIIWGGNYFSDVLPSSMGWIVWDKGQRDFSLADAELAWTSYNKALRVADISRGRAREDGKQHPTQKSLELMSFCLAYAERAGGKPIKTVIDPFGGSGTTSLACKSRGIKCVMVEQVEAYAEIAASRMAQEYLFAPAPAASFEPPRLLFDERKNLGRPQPKKDQKYGK